MKQRLDVALPSAGWLRHGRKARALILAGDVLVNGQSETKAGALVDDAADDRAARGLALCQPRRAEAGACAGLLSHCRDRATSAWTPAPRPAASPIACCSGAPPVSMRSMSAMGSSTGELRSDPRVVVMERTNIRYLDSLPEQPASVCRRCLIHLAAPGPAGALPALARMTPSAWRWSSRSLRPGAVRWARAASCVTSVCTGRFWPM